MARDLDGAIAELAPKRLGLLTISQLDGLGVSRQQRRTLVARGVLVPVAGRVVRHAAHPVSWQQATLAPVLVAGGRCRRVPPVGGRGDRQAGAERAARLGLLGRRVVEFTYEDVVERPSYVVEMIRDHLGLPR